MPQGRGVCHGVGQGLGGLRTWTTYDTIITVDEGSRWDRIRNYLGLHSFSELLRENEPTPVFVCAVPYTPLPGV